MTLALVTTVSAAVPNWDITGTWTWVQYGDIAHSYSATHTMNIAAFNTSTGDFSGTGTQIDDATNTWTVVGNVTGNNINFVLTTDSGSHYAGYILTATGTIAPDGKTIVGSGTDTYGRTTPWNASGVATAIVDSCPVGTNRVLLETKDVPSNSTAATLSNPLPSGKNYLLVSSKTWTNTGIPNVADTEYASMDNWSTVMDGYNISPYHLGEGEFDLQVNGTFINWGGYNPLHTYSHLYAGTGSPVSFLIFDGDSNTGIANPGWYGDNSGSLSVDIYSCNPNLPTDKDQCKKDGWKIFKVFKNQGDCVSFVATGGKNLPALLP